MSHWKKQSLADDITNFLTLIEKYEPPIDVSKIYGIENTFLYKNDYIINIKDIVFNINSTISGTLPPDVTKISIYFEHFCEYDETKDSMTEDLIKSNYCFKLKIVGYDKDNVEYTNWWRLDQDIEGESEHKCTHPYYHFQAGGDELLGIDIGKTIFTGAPRIAHPPMDFFLGFHFIVNNFYNKKQFPFVKKMMLDDIYQSIIIRAQKRLWEPYFNAFNDGSTHLNFTKEKIFPLYSNH